MLLLGRHSRLVLDSWTRPKYARLMGKPKGRLVADRTIARRFRRYRDHAGLAFWLVLTRDWVDDDPERERRVPLPAAARPPGRRRQRRAGRPSVRAPGLGEAEPAIPQSFSITPSTSAAMRSPPARVRWMPSGARMSTGVAVRVLEVLGVGALLVGHQRHVLTKVTPGCFSASAA